MVVSFSEILLYCLRYNIITIVFIDIKTSMTRIIKIFMIMKTALNEIKIFKILVHGLTIENSPV